MLKNPFLLAPTVVAGNPLSSLSNELVQTNKMTKEQLDQWKAKLRSTLEAARKFESGNEDMTAWITAMQRRLDHEEGVRATVDGVQKQLEDAKVFTFFLNFLSYQNI